MSETTPELPSKCPCCGAYSLAVDTDRSALLAVCDVLVVKALESIGKYVVRKNRSRYKTMQDRGLPWHVMHTVWDANDETVTRALQSAWDVVPALLDAHGCCDVTSDDVTKMLNDYVHDLAVTGTAHSVHGDGGLIYRFQTRLGIPVYDHSERAHA